MACAVELCFGAVVAASTAGADTGFKLKIVKRGAASLGVTLDVAVRDSLADTDNHDGNPLNVVSPF